MGGNTLPAASSYWPTAVISGAKVEIEPPWSDSASSSSSSGSGSQLPPLANTDAFSFGTHPSMQSPAPVSTIHGGLMVPPGGVAPAVAAPMFAPYALPNQAQAGYFTQPWVDQSH